MRIIFTSFMVIAAASLASCGALNKKGKNSNSGNPETPVIQLQNDSGGAPDPLAGVSQKVEMGRFFSKCKTITSDFNVSQNGHQFSFYYKNYKGDVAKTDSSILFGQMDCNQENSTTTVNVKIKSPVDFESVFDLDKISADYVELKPESYFSHCDTEKTVEYMTEQAKEDNLEINAQLEVKIRSSVTNEYCPQHAKAVMAETLKYLN